MYKAIEANKRNTIIIMTVFVALIGAIGWLLYAMYGDGNIVYVMFAVAIIYALVQYFIADKLAVAMTGAKPIQKSDNPRLYRIVENLAITTGMQTPKIYIINDPAPNAFATGRDPRHAIVAATTGLLDIMEDSELEAVMAHEMGHVQNYDIRVSMITFGLVSAIAILSDIALRMMFFSGGDNRGNQGSNPIIMVVGLIFIILAPVIATIVQLAVGRQREYLADATGAMTTRHPEALANALGKLNQYGKPMRKQDTSTAHLFISNPLKKGTFSKLFSTHPPLQDRINRLMNIRDKF